MKNLKKFIYATTLLLALTASLIFCVGTTAFATSDNIDIPSSEELSFYLLDINSRIDQTYQLIGIDSLNISSYKLVKDLDTNTNTFIALEFAPTGYAIYNRETSSVMQRQIVGQSPYANMNGDDYYYNGFNAYFYKFDNNIYDNNDKLLTTGEKLSFKNKIKEIKDKDLVETEKNFKNASNRSRETTTIYMDDIWKSIYFQMLSKNFTGQELYSDNDRYFGKNFTGTCGQIAGGALLQFYSRNNIAPLVPNSISREQNYAYVNNETFNIGTNQNPNIKNYRGEYYNTSYRLNKLAENLHQYLRYHSDPLIGTAMTSTGIKDMLNSYLNYMKTNIAGFPQNVSAISRHSTNIADFIKTSIDNNHPSIVVTVANVGNVASLTSNGLEYFNVDVSMHCVIAYGYTTSSLITPNEYLCHVLWDDSPTEDYLGNDFNPIYSLVYINRTILEGAVRLQFS